LITLAILIALMSCFTLIQNRPGDFAAGAIGGVIGLLIGLLVGIMELAGRWLVRKGIRGVQGKCRIEETGERNDGL
jgi:hypothetical protein